MARPDLVLASGSPRRFELLKAADVPFDVIVSHANEDLLDPMPAAHFARAIAARKATAVAQGLGAGPPRWVLGADTVVALGEDPEAVLLGKPLDAADARRMLHALSGTRHRVITGLCVVRTADGAQFQDDECTWVHMRPITPKEIDGYVASLEWQDKAGGYAIQESADAFVERLEGGGFDNVVGLPVERVFRLLALSGLALR